MADSLSSSSRQYRDYTRYLRPVRPVSFSDIEMLQSVVQCLDPEDIASVAQLLGNRRGVVRITMKTMDGVARLEDVVQRRRLTISGSPLGIVEDGGQFVIVTLDNVPQFVTDEQVEHEMSKYGVVAACSKDFIDIRGCRIENERRNVLYSMVFNKAAVNNGELPMFGTTVYAKTPYDDLQAAEKAAEMSATGTNSAESSSRRGHATTDSEQHPTAPPPGKSHGGGGGATSGSRSSRSTADGQGGSGGGAWKRASQLVTMHGGDSTQPTSTTAVTAIVEQSSSSVSSSAGKSQNLGGITGVDSLPQPQQPSVHGDQLTPTKRIGPRHSIPGRQSGSCDQRQLQKRTEAFEQLSAFLQ